MSWAVLAVLGTLGAPGGAAPLVPQELVCVGRAEVLGLDDRFQVVRYQGGHWEPAGIPGPVVELWRAPDGRLLTWTHSADREARFAFEIREGQGVSARWRLPDDVWLPRFFVLDDGAIGLADRKIYRLETKGRLSDLGEMPTIPSGLRPGRAPLMISARGTKVLCVETSTAKADANLGHCFAVSPRPYHFGVEFGGPLAGKAQTATVPFACSEVVVASHNARTEAHRLVDGALVGKSNLAARRGSTCLSETTALLVGSREILLVRVPALIPLWRRKVGGQIRSATLCGGKVAALIGDSPRLTIVDLP